MCTIHMDALSSQWIGAANGDNCKCFIEFLFPPSSNGCECSDSFCTLPFKMGRVDVGKSYTFATLGLRKKCLTFFCKNNRSSLFLPGSSLAGLRYRYGGHVLWINSPKVSGLNQKLERVKCNKHLVGEQKLKGGPCAWHAGSPRFNPWHLHLKVFEGQMMWKPCSMSPGEFLSIKVVTQWVTLGQSRSLGLTYLIGVLWG